MICVECELMPDTTIRLCPFHAATPKLLAACRKMLRFDPEHSGPAYAIHPYLEQVRAAIATAEGK
jgi:hypothetical protein